MGGYVKVAETGDVIECPDVTIQVPLPGVPTVVVDAQVVPVTQALSLLAGLRDYWKARAMRFETELADERAKKVEL